MQLRTPVSRNRSQDEFLSSTNETPRTASQTSKPKRLLFSSASQRKMPISPFTLNSIPHSVENASPNTERASQPANLFQKRFKLLMTAADSRPLQKNISTVKIDSKEFSTHNVIMDSRASTTDKPSYRKKKTPFQTISLNLKEKTSINHFLFPFGQNKTSPIARSGVFNNECQPHESGSDSYARPAGTAHSKSLTTSLLLSPNQIITTKNQPMSARQQLNEIQQSGPFHITKYDNVISSIRDTRYINDNNSKGDITRFNDMFKTKKTAMITNRQALSYQNTPRGNFHRKMEIEEIIERNKERVMVCALNENENKEDQSLKYCFIEREVLKSKTPRTTRLVREDVEFKITLHEIQKKLHLEDSYKFIHLLNGLPIFAFNQVPISERVVVIGQNSRLEDINKISNNELVRKFCSTREKKNGSMSDIVTGFDAPEKMSEFSKEILSIVDNTHQLNSEQLGKLVNISNQGSSSEFSKAIQGAFLNSWIGSTIEEERTISVVNKSYLHPRPSKKSTYFDTLLAPKGVKKKKKIELGIHETEVEEYIRSSKPLQEHEKIASFKNIIKEYDNGLKKIHNKEEEEDYEEPGRDQRGTDYGEEEIQTLSAKDLKIDENLEVLLRRFSRTPLNTENVTEIKVEPTNLNVLTLNGSTSKTTRNSEFELFNLSAKQNFDKQSQISRRLTTVSFSQKDKKEAKKFMEENIKALDTKKTHIRNLNKMNRELVMQNIPKIIKEKQLSRQELHSIYVLYKALCEVSSQRHKQYSVKEGIDFDTFRNGIYSVAVQSEEFASRLFYAIDSDFSGFLDWEEFLKAMVKFRAKTLHDKIDLFIRVRLKSIADEDCNGKLSKNEIFNLSKICLRRFVKDTADGFLDELCHYFTKLIFGSLGYDMNREIPLDSIKKAIFSVYNPEPQNLTFLLCFVEQIYNQFHLF